MEISFTIQWARLLVRSSSISLVMTSPEMTLRYIRVSWRSLTFAPADTAIALASNLLPCLTFRRSVQMLVSQASVTNLDKEADKVLLSRTHSTAFMFIINELDWSVLLMLQIVEGKQTEET